METAAQLVSHENFPGSVINLSLTGIKGHVLANERSVWHQALNVYFPGILPHKKMQKAESPKALFVFLYQNITPLLHVNHLNFADYVASVLHQTPVAPNSMPALQGLRLIAGHLLLEGEAPNAAIVEQALLFAATMGHNDFAEWHFEKQNTIFSHDILQQALLLAARSGHQRLFNLLLTHGHGAFDANCLRNALLAAAVQGHTRIVAPLLLSPYLKMISFSLKKVVELAISHSYPEMLTLLLREKQHLRYSAEISNGVIEAAKHNQDAIIVKAYHLAAVHFNDTTICKIVKIAAAQGNLNLITFFASFPALLKSPSTILQAVRSAMQNGHNTVALHLIQHCRESLRVYVKRELLLLAVQLGQHEIVDDFIKHDDAKAELNFYENALNIALFQEHVETVYILREKLNALASDKENQSRNVENVEHLAQAFARLNVIPVDALVAISAKPYTPAYERSPQILRTSPSIEQHTNGNLMRPPFQ